MRHAVFAHRDFDFHARIVHFTQHLLHTPHRLAKKSRRLGELHHHHLAGLGVAGATARDQNILAVALVFGRYQPDATLLQQAANDGLGRPLHNFHHPALRATAAITADNARFHTVFVQDRAHLVGGQIDVGAAVIARHKSVSIAVALDNTFDFVQQAAGLTNLFDTIALFPEMPRWRNW